MLTFVQGDTGPNLIGTLTYPDTGDPVDLTNSDVVFQMRKGDDKRYTVNSVATITDAPNGTVRYDWGANDLATVGIYKAQFEITFDDGKIQTSDPPVEIEVRRQ